MAFRYGKTAAYTILKNEEKFIEKWLFYTAKFDYRVLLDTGSTDNSYEMLMEASFKDPCLIIKQVTISPWRFDQARMMNLDMIPKDVEWALSPDMDEYFSQNVLVEMERTIQRHPYVTNISCDRLDIYSETVRVGPPHYMQDGSMIGSPNLYGTNKIHRRHDYIWSQPIFEHLLWKHDHKPECEIYTPEIYLIHDQDFKKQSRPELYLKMLNEEFDRNPENSWTLWFLVNHYYKAQEMDPFIKYACAYLKTKEHDQAKAQELRTVLANIVKLMDNDIEIHILNQIRSVI